MAHPGGVRPHLERRGKPCFFEIEQGQNGQKASPARTKARTKKWEQVVGLLVEAKSGLKLPERLEFIGNWESEPVAEQQAGVVVLN